MISNSSLGQSKKSEAGAPEIGAQAWSKMRSEWLKADVKTNKDKPFAKSQPVSDSYREEVQDIIKAVKPPYPGFKHYISLEEMVDCLLEVWEEDEGF